jgi:hypothetical protein
VSVAWRVDSAESGDRERVAEANDATLDHAGRDPSSLTKSGLGTVAEDLIVQVARRAVTPDGKLDLTNGEPRPVGAQELVEVDDDVATSLQPVELLNTEISGSSGELADTFGLRVSMLIEAAPGPQC